MVVPHFYKFFEMTMANLEYSAENPSDILVYVSWMLPYFVLRQIQVDMARVRCGVSKLANFFSILVFSDRESVRL